MHKRQLSHSLSCLQSWNWSIDRPAGGNRCQYAQHKAPLNRLMTWSSGQWFWGVELRHWECTLSQGISLWTAKTVKREPQEHHMKNIASTRQWEKKVTKAETYSLIHCSAEAAHFAAAVRRKKKKWKTTLYLKRTAASTRNALILFHIKERANLYFTRHVFITKLLFLWNISYF